MNISYSWLKDYINLELSPAEVAATLTQLGLETGSVIEVESIKGGLKGIIVGEVITCQKHPNSDHLSVTTVNIGADENLPIVCGAPNVAAGQKVIVATVGTVLYKGDEQFTIQKSKIRGEVSMGMICAEDEIGLSNDHNGIMVLDQNAKPGTLASDFFNIQSDFVLEIDLTPNRIDSASHIGVARDLAAFLSQKAQISYTRPGIDAFKIDNHNLPISVAIENREACPRYSGLTISDVTVKESPEWLKNRLKVIGQNPINNIVDVTNYILNETGQPLHAFDATAVKGGEVIVKTLSTGTKFVTLDGIKRELSDKDLMICNIEDAMCIGGVFGGLQSGVKESTTSIFLESACFNPVYIRKTARRHGLNTDASFRFERGIDPNGTLYALKRAAMLIKEVAGGTISSDVVDIVADPSILEFFPVEVSYSNITRLIGKVIPKETIKSILRSLEIVINEETSEGLNLAVPPYRVDVKREADIIEEILRIYGYNNVEPCKSMKSTIQLAPHPDKMKLQDLISEMFTTRGFNEIMSNSLTKSVYYDQLESFKPENTVQIFNPLSSDLNGMRQTLFFGGLEAINRNTNFRNADLRLYEFGNVYHFNGSKTYNHPVKNYSEEEHIGIWITGKKETENWKVKEEPTSFFTLKANVDNILSRLGIKVGNCTIETIANDIFSEGLEYRFNNVVIGQIGYVSNEILKKLDISADVFYGDLCWTVILKAIKNHKAAFIPLMKYPEVKRDLALLIDKEVQFSTIKALAFKAERQILRSVNIFDVYEGPNLPEGKKSYAVSFILQDEEKTLNDKQIEKTMSRLINVYEREVGAQIR
ncbi:MAG: phenylalanine--tRNA ligase subunit beta [Bacteroidia bacterium]|nr:phenylalanine--tRNA ligase subunit beta [Bacteroidia bacterium]